MQGSNGSRQTSKGGGNGAKSELALLAKCVPATHDDVRELPANAGYWIGVLGKGHKYAVVGTFKVERSQTMIKLVMKMNWEEGVRVCSKPLYDEESWFQTSHRGPPQTRRIQGFAGCSEQERRKMRCDKEASGGFKVPSLF